MSERPFSVWRALLAVAVVVFVLVVIHGVLHRSVLPAMVTFLVLLGIGVAVRWPAIRERWTRRR